MTDNQKLLIREALRTGELLLKSQQEIALASDQRATNLCGFFIAAAAVLTGLAVSGENPTLRMLLMLESVALVLAACFAFQAAKPVEFDALGYAPSAWHEDINSSKDISVAEQEMLGSLDRRIAENNMAMSANGVHLQNAVSIAGASVIFLSVCVLFVIAMATV